MIRIERMETDSKEWGKWLEKCGTESKKLTCSEDVDDKLYREQKALLTDEDGLFHGKCACCECSIGSQYGDIEHFRPKKALRHEDDNTPVKVKDQTGREKDHPGYYWLAYDLNNLLPSCQICNQPGTKSGEKTGKRNCFPLKNEAARVSGPEEDLNREEPLLINPLHEDRSAHPEVQSNGELKGLTDRGDACIEIFHLNLGGRKASQRVTATRELEMLSLEQCPHFCRDRMAVGKGIDSSMKLNVGLESFTSLLLAEI